MAKMFTTITVSLGAKALTEVREAVAHAQKHPDHDPVVMAKVHEGRQSISWFCRECVDDA